jgi:hypothetical protein
VEAGNFPHKLQARGADFAVGYRWIEIKKGFDISAHRLGPHKVGGDPPLKGLQSCARYGTAEAMP